MPNIDYVESRDGELLIKAATLNAALNRYHQKYLQDRTAVMRYKGSVATQSALPASGNAVGDVWNVTATGENFAWDGTSWDNLGSVVDLSGYVTQTAFNTSQSAQDVVIEKAWKQENIEPFFDVPLDDRDYWYDFDAWGSGGTHYDVSTLISKLEDGWVHIEVPVGAAISFSVRKRSGEILESYSALVETKNINTPEYISVIPGYWLLDGPQITENGGDSTFESTDTTKSVIIPLFATDLGDEAVDFMDIYIDGHPSAASASSFDLRLSLYEGEYNGSYIPYHDSPDDIKTRVANLEVSQEEQDEQIDLAWKDNKIISLTPLLEEPLTDTNYWSEDSNFTYITDVLEDGWFRASFDGSDNRVRIFPLDNLMIPNSFPGIKYICTLEVRNIISTGENNFNDDTMIIRVTISQPSTGNRFGVNSRHGYNKGIVVSDIGKEIFEIASPISYYNTVAEKPGLINILITGYNGFIGTAEFRFSFVAGSTEIPDSDYYYVPYNKDVPLLAKWRLSYLESMQNNLGTAANGTIASSVADGGTGLPTEDAVYDFVTGFGYQNFSQVSNAISTALGEELTPTQAQDMINDIWNPPAGE